ncbi:hypothetical protein ACTWJ9_32615 (plasmid) [Streptomyces sp. GDS52]|uniref:hypothetical protein n=1 Tax=Streptomyces sp. GDS52 TaxID=3406419 RepID=UPI003FD49A82
MGPEPRADPADLAVGPYVDGEVVATGSPAGIPGHPEREPEAVERTARPHGTALPAGAVVPAGAATVEAVATVGDPGRMPVRTAGTARTPSDAGRAGRDGCGQAGSPVAVAVAGLPVPGAAGRRDRRRTGRPGGGAHRTRRAPYKIGRDIAILDGPGEGALDIDGGGRWGTAG